MNIVDKNMGNLYKQIIDHYGLMKQLKYIHSEYFELDEAIFQYENSGWDFDYEDAKDLEQQYRNHIAEEIADIEVMLCQLIVHYDIPPKDIDNLKIYKVERQLERIKEENER